jgi:hypothetical protein
VDAATPVGKAGAPNPNPVTVQGITGGTPVPAAVADGGDVTQGTKTDAAATDSTSAWSIISLLKSLRTLLAGTLATKQVTGAGTNRSATVGTTSALLMGSNSGRTKFIIKNDSTVVVWVNFGNTAVAAAGSGNYAIAANGGYWEVDGYTGPLAAISAGVATPISLWEL